MEKNYSVFKNSWILLLLLISSLSFAQTNTWVGGTTGTAAQRIDWNRAANWSMNLVPTNSHDVVIPNVTDKPTISTASSNTAAVCKSLTINANATLTVDNKGLTVSGVTSISGTLTFSSTGGIETFIGLVTVNAGGNWNNTANEAVTFRGGITNNNNFTAGTGVQTFDTNNQTLTGVLAIPNTTVTGFNLTNNGTLTVSIALAGTGTLTNTSTLNIGGNSSIANLANTGTINVSGSGTISTAITKFTNTGTSNLNGSGAITGITNNASGVVNLFNSGTITSFNNATSTSVLNISDLTVPTITTLTATAAGNTVNYNGEGNQDIKSTTYSNLILSGSGIKALSGAITVNKDLYVSSGTKLIDFEYQITGNNSGGKMTVENDATLVLGKGFDYPVPSPAATYNSNRTTFPTLFLKANINLMPGSTVQYIDYITDTSFFQSISTEPDYFNLVCEYPGQKRALGGTLNINGNFSTGANLDLSTNNPTINLKGDFFPGAAPTTISLTKNIFSIGGNFINNQTGGSFTNGNGTVVFNGSAAQSISGTGIVAILFNNLTINNTSGGVSIGITGANPNVTVSNQLTMTNGILTTSSANLLYVTNTASTGVSGGSSTSFVSGPIKWNLPASLGSGSTYNFPLGKGSSYLPFSLVNPTTGTGTPTAQAEAFNTNSGGSPIFAIPTNATTLGSLSNTEYWSLVSTGNFTNSSVSIAKPTAISPFDAIGTSVTVNGSYTSLDGAISTNGITNSNSTGGNRFFTFGRKNGIRTSVIAGSPFCAGSTVSVPYTITGTYVAGNTFIAQLSDALGSFTSPTNIGSNPSTAAGNISATIPSGSASGTKYRIRVISNTSPNNVIGEMNNANLTITAINTATLTSGAGTNNQDLCIGKALTAITFSITGASGIGAPSGLPTGVSASATGGVITISGTPTVSGIFAYSVPLLGGCGTVSATGTIKINAPTTFTSGVWSDGDPDSNKKAIFATDYTSASGQNINACSCEVKSGAILRISAKSSLTVQNEITNLGNGSNFIVESDANLIQVTNPPANINIGNITSKRDVKISTARNQYNYLGTPVAFASGQSFKTIFVGSTNTNVLYHNEATNKFYTSSGANVPGRGSAVQEPPSSTIITNADEKTTTTQFIGVPQNGTITLPIASSDPNPSAPTTYGYNLVGNPYPSNIDMIKLYTINGGATQNNISATFYFWDNNVNDIFEQQGSTYKGQAYAIYNALPGNTGTGTYAAGSLNGAITGKKKPTNIVKVGQGFMTRSLKNAYNFKFDNNIRTSDTPDDNIDFLGKGNFKSQDDRYWLKMIAPSEIISTIAIVHYPGGNNHFGAEDSKSMGGSDAVYSIVENEKLAIDGRESFQKAAVIPLGTQHFVSGNYTIAIDTAEGVFSNGQNIYLKDKQTGTVTNLSEGSYTFAANAGESSGRFEIIYQPEIVLVTDTKVKEGILIYRDQDDFVIKSPKIMSMVQVYDASGKLITVLKPNDKNGVLNVSGITNGMYVLKITSTDGEVTNRKISR